MGRSVGSICSSRRCRRSIDTRTRTIHELWKQCWHFRSVSHIVRITSGLRTLEITVLLHHLGVADPGLDAVLLHLSLL